MKDKGSRKTRDLTETRKNDENAYDDIDKKIGATEEATRSEKMRRTNKLHPNYKPTSHRHIDESRELSTPDKFSFLWQSKARGLSFNPLHIYTNLKPCIVWP